MKIEKSSPTIGVESFIGTGHRNGSLFIGEIEFEKERRRKDTKYLGGAWLSDSIEEIWTKDELFRKIEEYTITPEKIVEELVEVILNYINNRD